MPVGEAKALIPTIGRLPGADGRSKMSKSQGNAIALSASNEEIAAAIQCMYTDPGHLRASDPGCIEGNVVFTYLDAFDQDHEAVAELKAHYQRGGLGDMVVKRPLETELRDVVGPMRERCAVLTHPDWF
jgi:tryptophanyl-tRNA synthetase